MIGIITGRDVLTHPFITIQAFGWKIFFKALFASQGQTFLSLLPKIEVEDESHPKLASLVQRCIVLELKAESLYAAFAQTFANRPAASNFFKTLADQEHAHAELLSLCAAAARHSGWTIDEQNPWDTYLPYLEKHLQRVEDLLAKVNSLDSALRMVVEIESSEVNRVFQSVLASCNSAFVKCLSPFRRAVETHISYITKTLPTLEPSLMLASRELRGLFPKQAKGTG